MCGRDTGCGTSLATSSLFPPLMTVALQNVTSSSIANAVLEAARYAAHTPFSIRLSHVITLRDIKSPIIIQCSQGGSAYFAGKGLANDQQQASITGAIACAHHVRTVAKAYGV